MLREILRTIAGKFGRAETAGDEQRDARGRRMPPKPTPPSGYPAPGTIAFRAVMPAASHAEAICPSCGEPIEFPRYDNPHLTTIGICSRCGYVLAFEDTGLRGAKHWEIDVLRERTPEIWRLAEGLQRQWRQRVLPFDALTNSEMGGGR